MEMMPASGPGLLPHGNDRRVRAITVERSNGVRVTPAKDCGLRSIIVAVDQRI